MELFKIFGTIALNSSGAIEGIDKTTDKAEKAHYKIKQSFSKIGDVAIKAGKVMASGLAVGATAMVGLATKALQLGGELEQNMGGSIAVFGDYAEEVQKKATEAFDKMGLSASDYLATANKMGALFMGAGFDTATTVEMTTRAMQRAADVASIMGIDVSAAMEAIAGAAKGNFTMMDNLGVAMNDTALGVYALSKGITKSTSDMTQMEKIGLAMEMFLEKTAYAAGNYANENDTLAGALTTAKAAFSNFLSGVGDAHQLTDALVNASGVLIDKIQTLLPRLIEGLNTLMTNLLPHIPVILESLLPGVLEGAGALMLGLATILPDLVQLGFDMIVSLAEGVAGNISEITAVANEVVSEIVGTLTNTESVERFLKSALAIIIAIAKGIAESLPRLTSAAVSVVDTVVEILTEDETLSALLDAALAIILALTVALIEVCPKLIDASIEIVNKIIDFLCEDENMEKITQGAIDLIVALASALIRNVGNIGRGVTKLAEKIVEVIFETDWVQVGKDIIDAIAEGLSSIEFKTPFQSGYELGQEIADQIASGSSNIKTPFQIGKELGSYISGLFVNGSHADGLDYVPYDGYIAELHKGEMVIPAAESMRIRAGVAVAQSAKKGTAETDEQGGVLAQYFQKLIEMLADYFPQIVNGMDRPIAVNPNSMAAVLAVPMNQELGRISARKDRGR